MDRMPDVFYKKLQQEAQINMQLLESGEYKELIGSLFKEKANNIIELCKDNSPIKN